MTPPELLPANLGSSGCLMLHVMPTFKCNAHPHRHCMRVLYCKVGLEPPPRSELRANEVTCTCRRVPLRRECQPCRAAPRCREQLHVLLCLVQLQRPVYMPLNACTTEQVLARCTALVRLSAARKPLGPAGP